MTETTVADFGAVTESLGTSMSSVSDGMLDAISIVMPYALLVGGAVLVICVGWKIFKKLAK